MGISYEFPLEMKTVSENMGKSEFDLQESEIPASKSKRKDEDGMQTFVKQYQESHKLIKETYSYIAECLAKL